MAEVRIPIHAAYTFIEALNDADDQGELRWKLRLGRQKALPSGGRREAETPDDKAFDSLRHHLQSLAYGLWVPRLMTTKTLDAINAMLEERPVVLRCNPFVRSLEQFCVGATAGMSNGVRDRVAYDYGSLYHRSGEPMAVELFKELCLEATIDWVVNSTRANYEVRKCAWCGVWFEPKIGGRSRFCDSRCRQEFNNARIGKDTAMFHCYKCSEDRPIDQFSGLGLSDNPFDEHDTRSSPLFFTSRKRKEGVYGGDTTCVSCIRQYYPEWGRYIAPITSRPSTEAAS